MIASELGLRLVGRDSELLVWDLKAWLQGLMIWNGLGFRVQSLGMGAFEYGEFANCQEWAYRGARLKRLI